MVNLNSWHWIINRTPIRNDDTMKHNIFNNDTENAQIISRYKKKLATILKCKEENIKFYIGHGKGYREMTNISIHTNNNSVNDFKVVHTIGDAEGIISCWNLSQLPHCCAIMVSSNVHVSYNYRNRGIGTVLNEFRKDIGRSLNFTTILCTDVEHNKHQRNILKKNGWKDIHRLVNKKTANVVFISVIDI